MRPIQASKGFVCCIMNFCKTGGEEGSGTLNVHAGSSYGCLRLVELPLPLAEESAPDTTILAFSPGTGATAEWNWVGPRLVLGAFGRLSFSILPELSTLGGLAIRTSPKQLVKPRNPSTGVHDRCPLTWHPTSFPAQSCYTGLPSSGIFCP